jgi:hypothetical protein
MPKVEFFQDANKAALGVPSWSFTVDGQASGYWCPTEHAVNRVVSRLEQGRSRAYEGKEPRARVVKVDAPVAMRTTKKGGEKPVEGAAFTLHLDGQEHPEPFATEKQARVAGAFKAFMSRGKLGRLKEAEEAFSKAHGKPGKAVYDGKSVVIEAADGTRHAARLVAGETPRFKALGA